MEVNMALIQNGIAFCLNIINSMAFSDRQKKGYGIFLVLIILLVGLHLAVAATGHLYHQNQSNPGIVIINGTNYSLRDYNQLAAFWIVAAGLTFFLSIILLVAICGNYLTAKLRHMLSSITLVLEFAIAVTISITASKVSNLRDLLYEQYRYPSNDDLEIYYKLLIADAVITFVLEFIYLVLLYLGTLDDVDHTLVVEVPQGFVPPVTSDNLN